MLLRDRRWVGWIGGVLLGVVALPALAADAVTAVETSGSGTLTMCRSWLVYTSCQDYNHIAVPARFKLGDSLSLVFGSNTKKIAFPVARIAQDGDRCTVYNDPKGGTGKVDKIELEPCHPVAP